MAPKKRIFVDTSGKKTKVKAIRNIVKKEVNKNLEVKQWQYSYLKRGLTDYGNVTANRSFQDYNVFPLGPSDTFPLKKGTGNSSRVGNKIRIKKAMLKLILYPNPYDTEGLEVNTVPRPFDVRCIFLHSKQTPTEVIPSNTFFDLNNATVNPGDDLQDQLLNVNKDIYVVNKDVRFKVGYRGNGGTTSDTVLQAANQFWNNNDYKLNIIKNFNITKMLPTNMEFNDSVTVPTSFMPYLVMLISPADGGDNELNEYPIRYYSEVTIQYTDA